MDLLNIVTAGSVDDGKSTLIGRLLYETGSLKKDQLEHIQQKSKARGYDYLDFSLATDGLLTEREQGITIDVSHIYLGTNKRRFVIADSPGHIEYTRNMITGASNAQVAILLLDARKGVTEQSRRHLFISQLLKINQVVVAVNKMDLVNYDEKVFNKIVQDFKELNIFQESAETQFHFIPVSALKGDNITSKSKETNWYKDNSLIELLEQINLETEDKKAAAMQVQYVIRPKTETHHDYRGFAGKVRSGCFHKGDSIEISPSGRSSTIQRIEKYGQEIEEVHAGENCTLILSDEIDISRGDSIYQKSETLQEIKNLKPMVCWLQNNPIQAGKRYWLQHGNNRVLSKVKEISSEIHLNDFTWNTTSELGLNSIGAIELTLANPILASDYKENKSLGAFILIDEQTNNTAGVGIIQ